MEWKPFHKKLTNNGFLADLCVFTMYVYHLTLNLLIKHWCYDFFRDLVIIMCLAAIVLFYGKW